jgi:Reverse transcriptase (RNA-dependent DNA polymerase)
LLLDDLIYTGNSEEMMQKFKGDDEQYEMSDPRLMKYFLGIEVVQTENGIFISQKKYAEGILKKNKMQNCKSITTQLIPNEKFSKENGSIKVDLTEYIS